MQAAPPACHPSASTATHTHAQAEGERVLVCIYIDEGILVKIKGEMTSDKVKILVCYLWRQDAYLMVPISI